MGQKRVYEYNSAREKTKFINRDEDTRVYTYDEIGRPTSETMTAMLYDGSTHTNTINFGYDLVPVLHFCKDCSGVKKATSVNEIGNPTRIFS